MPGIERLSTKHGKVDPAQRYSIYLVIAAPYPSIDYDDHRSAVVDAKILSQPRHEAGLELLSYVVECTICTHVALLIQTKSWSSTFVKMTKIRRKLRLCPHPCRRSAMG